MTIPCRWADGGLSGFAGRVRFRRRFGYPGRLDAHERVWLTLAGVDAAADVRLNEQFLGRVAGQPAEFEVTGLLAARNELVMEVEGPETGGLTGEVALEVRCTAYLRAVRVGATFAGEQPILQVAGEVVGTCDRPLELYVLLDGSTVVYTTLEAIPEGNPFEVASEPLPAATGQPGQSHVVRVDLVNGAVVWFRWEEGFAFPGPGSAP
jgi:hypothetical protein